MKVVILAGGKGTRIPEETVNKPKPMVTIGGVPLLQHIMNHYKKHGLNEFIVCTGYKGDMIRDAFPDVLCVDTGEDTMTGGRLKRIAPMLTDTFCMTYGDGVSDVHLGKLLNFHRDQGTSATVTAVPTPPSRYGVLTIYGDTVTRFAEKPIGGRISGGFFVFEPEILDLIEDEMTHLEREPLEHLASQGQLSAYRHDGFWASVDTLRDKETLEAKWKAMPW